MSDILIKSVEMPTKGYRLILVHADGTVQTTEGETTAISIPKHGRLIDVDALIKSDRMVGKLMMFGREYVYTQAEIDHAPTIISSSEERTK